MDTAEREATTLRDLREKCFALDVVFQCLTLPLLRLAPPEVSAALLEDVRTIVPQLIDDPAVDRARVLDHIADHVNQIALILTLSVPPDATPN